MRKTTRKRIVICETDMWLSNLWGIGNRPYAWLKREHSLSLKSFHTSDSTNESKNYTNTIICETICIVCLLFFMQMNLAMSSDIDLASACIPLAFLPLLKYMHFHLHDEFHLKFSKSQNLIFLISLFVCLLVYVINTKVG